MKDPNLPRDFSEAQLQPLADALFAGRKIEAIKLCRELTGLGLKEAKDAVEALEADLRTKFPEKFTGPKQKSGCLGAAAIFVVGVVMIGGWLIRHSFH